MVADENRNPIFTASTDNLKSVLNILKAVHFKEFAYVNGSDNGLKFTLEDSRCLQANCYLQRELFDEFNLKDDFSFKINLNILIECLQIFGPNNLYASHNNTASSINNSTKLKLTYSGYGHPLIIYLEDNGVVTDCAIKTLESEDLMDCDFSNLDVLNKVILKADSIKEIFNEMDYTSEVLEVLISPVSPYFRLSTYGDLGSIYIEFPKDSDAIDVFSCSKSQSNRFKYSLIKPVLKAINYSSKLSLRVDKKGCLSWQYLIKQDDNNASFIEFFCVPLDEYDEIV